MKKIISSLGCVGAGKRLHFGRNQCGSLCGNTVAFSAKNEKEKTC